MKKIIACKKCGHQIELTSADMGKTVHCPGCAYQFVVRSGKAATPQTPPPATDAANPNLGSPTPAVAPPIASAEEDEYKLTAPLTESAEMARLREVQRQDVQRLQDRVIEREKTFYGVVHEQSAMGIKAEWYANLFLITLYPAVVLVLFLRLIGFQEHPIVESVILFPPVVLGAIAGVMYWIGMHEHQT